MNKNNKENLDKIKDKISKKEKLNFSERNIVNILNKKKRQLSKSLKIKKGTGIIKRKQLSGVLLA